MLKLTSIAGLAIAAFASAASAATVPIHVVAREGDALDESTISSFSQPFVNGLGQVGFVVGLADGSRSIWFDTGSIFNTADALPTVLTGHETTMGISNAGGFIYSPAVNGNDAVYTHAGLLLAEGDATPGIANGVSTFNSRPRMLDNGEAVWVGGFQNTATGGTGRVLYRGMPGDPGSITPVLMTGDTVDGFSIGTSGIGFDYDVSGNGNHHIQALVLDTGSTSTDAHIWVDGTVVAREGSPTGQGDNWSAFKSSSINNNGNYVFAGDTSGPTATDDFIAYNGEIAVRQGDNVGGRTLTGTIDAVAINDLDQAVFVWDTDLGETLFFASDASSLGSAIALLSLGDLVDVDGNGTGDYTLVDMNPSTVASPGLDFGNNGFVFLSVDLEDAGGNEFQAIIRVAVPAPGSALALGLGGLLASRRRR